MKPGITKTDDGQFRAVVTDNGRRLHDLGCFPTAQAALVKFLAAAKELRDRRIANGRKAKVQGLPAIQAFGAGGDRMPKSTRVPKAKKEKAR